VKTIQTALATASVNFNLLRAAMMMMMVVAVVAVVLLLMMMSCHCGVGSGVVSKQSDVETTFMGESGRCALAGGGPPHKLTGCRPDCRPPVSQQTSEQACRPARELLNKERRRRPHRGGHRLGVSVRAAPVSEVVDNKRAVVLSNMRQCVCLAAESRRRRPCPVVISDAASPSEP
jgi:hypothetical protein